ncbi:hypothetical protein, partial [Roseibium hamelinense]
KFTSAAAPKAPNDQTGTGQTPPPMNLDDNLPKKNTLKKFGAMNKKLAQGLSVQQDNDESTVSTKTGKTASSSNNDNNDPVSPKIGKINLKMNQAKKSESANNKNDVLLETKEDPVVSEIGKNSGLTQPRSKGETNLSEHVPKAKDIGGKNQKVEVDQKIFNGDLEYKGTGANVEFKKNALNMLNRLMYDCVLIPDNHDVFPHAAIQNAMLEWSIKNELKRPLLPCIESGVDQSTAREAAANVGAQVKSKQDSVDKQQDIASVYPQKGSTARTKIMTSDFDDKLDYKNSKSVGGAGFERLDGLAHPTDELSQKDMHAARQSNTQVCYDSECDLVKTCLENQRPFILNPCHDSNSAWQLDKHGGQKSHRDVDGTIKAAKEKGYMPVVSIGGDHIFKADFVANSVADPVSTATQMGKKNAHGNKPLVISAEYMMNGRYADEKKNYIPFELGTMKYNITGDNGKKIDCSTKIFAYIPKN